MYPREVEDVLLAHPAVAEVAVVGEPSDEWGEVVVAVVVADRRADRARPSCSRTRRESSRRTSGRGACASSTRCPRNALGKVLRHEL